MATNKIPKLPINCKDITGRRREKHGMARTPFYRTWKGRNSRCYNPKNPAYKNYGGRGITVCDEWKNSFVAFMDYVEENLGPKPSTQHTVDRINNDGNYELGNIRWTTWGEQANNRRPISCGPAKQYWFRAWHKDQMRQFVSNNQNQFARQHGLDCATISKCLLNKQPQHKGWTFQRI